MDKKKLWLAAQIGAVLLISVAFWWKFLSAYDSHVYRDAEILAEVRSIVMEDYIKDISSKELLEGALRGMMSTLDEYSEYLNEKEYQKLHEGVEGKFVGIGIEITIENSLLTVIAPIEDSPAARAGVLAGDKIIAINGKNAEGIPLSEGIKRLRGNKGEKVVISVIHEGSKLAQDIEIVRDIITIQSIKDAQILEGNIGYLRLVKFNNTTQTELKKKINKLQQQKAQSLIVDLRFNPGGSLKAAVEIVDCFIKEGVIVFIKGRNPKSHSVYRATAEDTYSKLSLIILINKRSASASEIVAGALQDYHRAVIVGSRSYGKGKVQSIIPLRDEKTAVKLTTAYYYTPSGRNIQKDEKAGYAGGIEPDVVIPMSLPEERELLQWIYRPDMRKKDYKLDNQLRKALEILKKKK